jgi:Lon protease-like protein
MARIAEVTRRYDDGRMDILTRGERRFQIHEIIEEKPYMEALIVFLDDDDEKLDDNLQDLIETARKLLKEISDPAIMTDSMDIFTHTTPQSLSFAIAALEGFTPAERQRFLEMTSGNERLKKSVHALSSLVQRFRLTQNIQRIIGGNGHPPKDLLAQLSDSDTS